MMKRIFGIFLFFLFIPSLSFSHPGGLDSQGGHVDKKTGLYHYHKNVDKPGQATPAVATPYNREDWPHWIDEDNDCQNTRMEIRIRDNIGLLKYKRNNYCTVTWGKWVCPYTGKEITKASDLDIDHIVPLSHAHKVGGAQWSREKKREFANDPMNLLAVDDNTNQEKGDQAPDEWKPPMKIYWPEYARKWRTVKEAYGLYISPAEEAALKEMGR